MTARPTDEEIAEQAWNDGFSDGYNDAFEKYGKPLPFPEGVETTELLDPKWVKAEVIRDDLPAEERIAYIRDLALQCIEQTEERLDRALAEITRLNGIEAEAMEAGDIVREQQAEIARLTAALAEAGERILEYQSIVEASPTVQKAMGHYYDKLREVREQRAREEEREAIMTYLRNLGYSGSVRAIRAKSTP